MKVYVKDFRPFFRKYPILARLVCILLIPFIPLLVFWENSRPSEIINPLFSIAFGKHIRENK